MTHEGRISPSHICEYARLHGWVPFADAGKDRLLVLNYPPIDLMQIVVPLDASRPDFGPAVRIAIERLAQVESVPFHIVEGRLLQACTSSLDGGVTT